MTQKSLSSRLARFEEKKLRTRLVFAILGSLLFITLVIVFGFQFFIRFFIFLDQMRGKDVTKQETAMPLVIPPYLDPLPLATTSGELVITGRGQPNATLLLYINNEERKKITIPNDGVFTVSSVSLPEGTHTIQAKTADKRGKTSDFSNAVRITIKKRPPSLDILAPNNNETIIGENNLVTIEGKTDEGNDVRINDRFVIVKPNGFFSYPYPLQEGENIITIRAIDRAGNTTEKEQKILYKK